MSEQTEMPTPAQAAQRRGEARLAPYLPAIQETMSELARMRGDGEFVLVFPESEWADVPADERAVMVFGCPVVHAYVPAVMVAVKARRTLSFEAGEPT